jgi:hypothetical protein
MIGPGQVQDSNNGSNRLALTNEPLARADHFGSYLEIVFLPNRRQKEGGLDLVRNRHIPGRTEPSRVLGRRSSTIEALE